MIHSDPRYWILLRKLLHGRLFLAFFLLYSTVGQLDASKPIGQGAISALDCTFEITNCPDYVVVNADANCQAKAYWTSPSFIDDCDTGGSLDSTHISGSFFALGETQVTYTLSNDLGNTDICQFNVIVVDITPPLIMGCPTDTTIYPMGCLGIYYWDETAMSVQDNCDAVLIPDPTYHPGDAFSVGTTTVTYTAVDGSGNPNLNECIFVVTVVDTFPPSANCPDDIVVTVLNGCDTTVTWTEPDFSDGCIPAPVVTSNFSPGASFNTGTFTVVYEATDANGDTGSCQFGLTVKDNTPPVLSTDCPNDTILYVSNNSCEFTYNYPMPTGTDLCDATITVTATPSGNQFAVGTQLVEIVAIDDGGNQSAPCTFTVDTRDTLTPTTVCPGGIIIKTDGTIVSDPDGIVDNIIADGCNQPLIQFSFPDINDNCSAYLVDSTVLKKSFPLGVFIHTYSFQDPSANTGACAFEVKVDKQEVSVVITASSNPVCEGSSVTLSTSINNPSAQFIWTGPASFSSTDPTPTIDNFAIQHVGDYIVVVDNGCEPTPTDTIHLDFAQQITAFNDTYSIPLNTIDTFDVTFNDELLGQYATVEIEQSPIFGTAEEKDAHIIYFPSEGYIGADQLIYKVCLTSCPDICESAVVSIDVNLAANGDTCIIPNVITPNFDGLNDELIVNCVTATTNNSKIIIYNQWGGIVYEASPYLNNWQGGVDGETSKPLPDGTYFYLFWRDQSQKPQKGFITLFR